MQKRGFLRAFLGALLLSAALARPAPTASHAAGIDLPVATYVVQRYDTLKAIAARYGVSLHAILALNDIPDPDSLEIGRELLVPLWEQGAPAPGVAAPAPRADDGAPPALAPAPEMPVDQPPAAPEERTPNAASSRGGRQPGSGPIWPLSGLITQRFMEGGHHKGIDIAAPHGTPVVAAKEGTARFSGQDASGYGKYVVVDHPDGSSALYAHFSRLAVDAGDQVGQGDVVGYVGATGIATGPHLHFELRQGNSLVDPLAVLP